ncbi:ATP-binding protein [Pedobacter sp. P351]|uniref:ATP-binding protein n=1 Tax=Pedobacter superstes TaxID=3133441 RepID=UPI0030A9D335
MTELELQEFLQLQYPKENESCEWKEFKSLKLNVSGHKGEDVISYVSAISNINGGWLILGVEDTSLKIIGIQDFHDFTPENLPFRLIGNCTNLPEVGLMVESYTTSDTGKTIWIIHIPKHQPRKPVYAHKTGWQRIGDNLTRIKSERLDSILNEPLHKIHDWSAQVIPLASINDLDINALLLARTNFKSKFPNLSGEVDTWDDTTFLNKAKLTINGKITRTAIILLGKTESEHFINPSEVKIRWILKDRDGSEKDYQIVTCPFILAVDEVYHKIRNLKYRYINDSSLFPEEILQYEPYIIREALNNCIAHQDYELSGRINVVEADDRLIFSNKGTFIPGSVEKVIQNNSPEEQYRNPFLVTAMFNLKMVDTIGSGIRRMFTFQKQRFFPMPEFEIANNKVEVTIIGKVLDPHFAKTLAKNPDLSLNDIILLDKIQKQSLEKLTEEDIKYLKGKKLIEGRKPNYILAEKIAQKTDQVATYIKNRGFDMKWYCSLVIEFLQSNKVASRQEIRDLLLDKLPNILNTKQKENKITHVLTTLRKKGKISNDGSDTRPMWKLRKEFDKTSQDI